MTDPNVFRLLSYGMYVVASFRQGKPPDVSEKQSNEPAQGKLNGQIATTVFQVTAEPALVAVSLNCQNLTHEMIAETKRFSVSILSQEAPLKFIGLFGFKCGRSVDKFSGLSHKVLKSGTPVILDHSLGWLDLEVTQAIPLGTHTLFVGRVVDSAMLMEGFPLDSARDGPLDSLDGTRDGSARGRPLDSARGRPMTYDYYHQVKGGKTQANAPTFIKT